MCKMRRLNYMISNSVQLNLQLNQNIENLIEITSTELLHIESHVNRNRELDQIVYIYTSLLILNVLCGPFLVISPQGKVLER